MNDDPVSTTEGVLIAGRFYFDRASHDARLEQEIQRKSREGLIRNLRITDEEFLDECYQIQGSAATENDYDQRRQLRALHAWAKLHDVDPILVDIHGGCQLHNLRGYITEGTFGSSGVPFADEAIRMIWAEHQNALSTCHKCRRYENIKDPPIFVLTWNRHWCSVCVAQWLSTPSTPPATGIRPALARARAAKLPATLTNEEWQRTVEHFDNRCAFCGGPWCVVEHATSIAVGGPTTMANCLPSCVLCNNAKRDNDLQGLDGKWDEERLAKIWAWLEANGRIPRNPRHRRRNKVIATGKG